MCWLMFTAKVPNEKVNDYLKDRLQTLLRDQDDGAWIGARRVEPKSLTFKWTDGEEAIIFSSLCYANAIDEHFSC